MTREALAGFRAELERQRRATCAAVAGVEADLEDIAEQREAEFEERAQDARAARLYAALDDRGKREIDEIDAALRRIAEDRYGTCAGCAEPIALARLRALPATRWCIRCACVAERSAGGTAAVADVPTVAAMRGDLALLGDRELTDSLRELVRDDGRVDVDELRIVCRHGIVHLAGALPSATEHEIVRKLIVDIAEVREIDDRVEVAPLLWERDERTERIAAVEAPAWAEPARTEDLVDAIERGIDYEPPTGPGPDEE
jgi:DnaK suppressor protein